MVTSSPSNIPTRIRDFIAEDAQVPSDDLEFTSDVHLFDAGYLDSLRLVSLISFVESTFGVQLCESALFSPDFTTINGIARLVQAARVDTAPAPRNEHRNIRPATEADLPGVASLYEQVERSGSRSAAPGLVDYFRRLLFAQPHADPELPSLVYEEEGEILGFLGVHARRLRFNDRQVRAAWLGQLVAAKEHRKKGIGTLLLRMALNGPQDLTLTDGATQEVVRMWEGLGSYTRGVGSLRWTRLLRPWRFAADYAARRPRYGRLLAPLAFLARPLCAAADAVTRWVTDQSFKDRPSDVRSEPLTPKALVEGFEALEPFVSLAPAYTEKDAQWLLFELGEAHCRGLPRGHLLRGPDGRVLGWYLYYLKPGGISHALQIAALPDQAETVLRHLFADADERGSIAVQGRVEPGLVAALSDFGASLQEAWAYAVLHTGQADLAAAVHAGDALLTRLDGEWWCAFKHETFGRGTARSSEPDAPAKSSRPAVLER